MSVYRNDASAVPACFGGDGAETFLDLSDTPDIYPVEEREVVLKVDGNSFGLVFKRLTSWFEGNGGFEFQNPASATEDSVAIGQGVSTTNDGSFVIGADTSTWEDSAPFVAQGVGSQQFAGDCLSGTTHFRALLPTGFTSAELLAGLGVGTPAGRRMTFPFHSVVKVSGTLVVAGQGTFAQTWGSQDFECVILNGDSIQGLLVTPSLGNITGLTVQPGIGFNGVDPHVTMSFSVNSQAVPLKAYCTAKWTMVIGHTAHQWAPG